MNSAGQAVGLSLIRAIPSAVVAMDGDGRVTALNGAAERLFNTTATEAIGRPYPAVFGASLADRMVGLFLRVARSGNPASAQLVRATLPGGRQVQLRANVGPLRDGAGRLAGLFFAAEDQSAEQAAVAESLGQAARTERLREALKRYIGDALAATVEARPSFIGLGGVRQPVSVLHADVRGYTTVAERLEPEAVTELLLRYHGAGVAALLAEGATLDRFIGDAILAIWNAPAPQAEHTRLAIHGALALTAATRAVGDELAYGVGVHTGEAVVGNLGSDRYMNYTAMGDTVNVAARLQSAAPSGEVVCSAAALAAAGPGIRTTPLGALAVKGRQAPVEAYRVEGFEG